MAHFGLERFKRLPQQRGELWWGGLFKMPAWLEDDHGRPYRPLTAMWMSNSSGLISKPRIVEPGEDPLRAAFEAILDSGLPHPTQPRRPSAVEVRDPTLASYLAEQLRDAGVRCNHVPELPGIQEAMMELTEAMTGRREPPAAMSAKGVTIDCMRAFAEAAALFYAARPWKKLSDEDLIVVEEPKPPAGLGYFSVLGGGGQTFGLGFFESVGQFSRMVSLDNPKRFFDREGVWSFQYGPITDLPFADADLWEDHKLPVAGNDAYPCLLWHGPKNNIRRPDAGALSFAEGLLRVMAEVTDADLDTERWCRSVVTNAGKVEYRFALVGEAGLGDSSRRSTGETKPDWTLLRRLMEREHANIDRLLEGHEFDSEEEANAFLRAHLKDGRAPQFEPRTPLEQAREVMYQAWGARGRRAIKLAKQALEICPDCADAYVLLAERTSEPQEACELYRKGTEAGERALGPETFQSDVGHFWGILETRPYMRARAGLADCLWALGQREESVDHYRDLLRLNPGDNQGIRYLLAACLLQLGRDDELGLLLDACGGEATAQWLYIRALWAFRREGDSPQARKRIKEAIKCNRHVPSYLLGRRAIPQNLPGSFRLGGEDEAAYCASETHRCWEITSGALEWLKKVGKKRS